MNPIISTVLFLILLTLPNYVSAQNNQNTLLPKIPESAPVISRTVGELTATFVTNEAYGPEHRRGYNGIAELYHTAQDSSVFVPSYSGFNLEHIFGGDSLEQVVEPRRHPMELFQTENGEIILYQSSTPLSNVESVTIFTMEPPHYIDVTFRCIIRDETFFRHGYAGLFWASYIQKPENKRIYFKGTDPNGTQPDWIAAFSDLHGNRSTHRSNEDTLQLYFAPDFNVPLAKDYSEYRYSSPFYYGRFHNMVLAFLFEPEDDTIIRFSQSPTGGGEANPAWDFQFIIPDPEPNTQYSFRARLIYKPFVSADDIETEYRDWKAKLVSGQIIPEAFRGKMQLFLLAGQSNMSGRGRLPDEKSEPNPKIFVFGNDYQWRPATEPIDDPHHQVDLVSIDPQAGFSPALAFAESLSAVYPEMVIGLIPCAKGGSTIGEWQRSQDENTLYGSMMKRVKAASDMGEIAGLLFFQGESDATDPQLLPGAHPEPYAWRKSFSNFIRDLRNDLNIPDLPVVFAQLGKNTAPEIFINWSVVKEQQESVHLHRCNMIYTDDLTLKDEVHFTRESYISIGSRFSSAYIELISCD